MALDFPTSPTNGQKFPASPIAGVPTYTWDSEKWTTQSDAIGNLYVAKSGDTMTGALALPGNPATALQAAPKQYVDTFAAPMDALAYSGIQVNGSMEVSQEFGTNSNSTSFWYCDQWGVARPSGVVSTAGQTAATHFLGLGFRNYLFATVTTPKASLAAADSGGIYHNIEGYRIARLAWGTANAQPITISFWTMHSRTGLYSVAVHNAASNRSYVTTYTQNAADTQEYKTVTIPGCTDGVWNSDNTKGFEIVFSNGCGTTFVTAPNVWTVGDFRAATGQVNAMAAATDNFRMTGITILPGTQAPSAARSPFIMRPFDQELMTCMRYYEKGDQPFSYLGDTFSQTKSFGFTTHKVVKRASPTITVTGWQYYSGGTPNTPISLVTLSKVTADGFGWIFDTMTSFNGWSGSGTWKSDARL